jgi:hypothetical protein
LRNGIPPAEEAVCDFLYLAFEAVCGKKHFAFLGVNEVRLEVALLEGRERKDGLEDRGDIATVTQIGETGQAWPADGLKRFSRIGSERKIVLEVMFDVLAKC